MTLHMPTHPSQAAHPHVFRNLFAAILIAIVAVLVVYAVTTTDLRSTTTPAPALTEMERMVEFRAGE
ncbi:MAG: hypothetical protein MUQ32_13925, partial [Chloroflexi bacterium]|nr:hypothetical protein [Chloroflexota bacterium]